MIRLLYFIPIWIAFMALKLVVAIFGLPILAYMWRYRSTSFEDVPKWTLPWLNPEDWVGGTQDAKGNVVDSLPQWWIDREGGIKFGMWWHYHAIRNPANGLRNFESLDLDPDMLRIKYITPQYYTYYEPWDIRKKYPSVKSYGYLCWQGLQAGAKWVYHWNDKRHFVIKIGWRIEPRDAREVIDPIGIRSEDSGFASKLLVYREG